MTISSGAVI